MYLKNCTPCRIVSQRRKNVIGLKAAEVEVAAEVVVVAEVEVAEAAGEVAAIEMAVILDTCITKPTAKLLHWSFCLRLSPFTALPVIKGQVLLSDQGVCRSLEEILCVISFSFSMIH